MPKHSNVFITAALEAMQDQGSSTAAPAVTETNIDYTTDAVAELMEKNAQLEDSNSEMKEEAFDNDLNAVETASDTVNQDLEEVVNAGAALEQLAELCNYTVRSGQANQASVAGLVFALEQITHTVGLTSPIPALEAEAMQLDGPKDQVTAVGNSAIEKTKELGKRLLDGIKRIIGWIIGVIRTAMARSTKIGERARIAMNLIASIDESKTIDAKPFISSLRLVEGGGDANKQFEAYGKLATKTLYGFYNDSFKKNMSSEHITKMLERRFEVGETYNKEMRQTLCEVLKTALSVIYTEHGDSTDVSTEIPSSIKDQALTVGLTEPCVGGLQMYLAATIDSMDENWYCRAGIAKKEVKLAHPDSIPVVNKTLAKDLLNVIQKWMSDQKKLESILVGIGEMPVSSGPTILLKDLSTYISTLSAMVTGSVPHLIRLNLQNSASFVAYVEKSAAVSKTTVAEPKK